MHGQKQSDRRLCFHRKVRGISEVMGRAVGGTIIGPAVTSGRRRRTGAKLTGNNERGFTRPATRQPQEPPVSDSWISGAGRPPVSRPLNDPGPRSSAEHTRSARRVAFHGQTRGSVGQRIVAGAMQVGSRLGRSGRGDEAANSRPPISPPRHCSAATALPHGPGSAAVGERRPYRRREFASHQRGCARRDGSGPAPR